MESKKADASTLNSIHDIQADVLKTELERIQKSVKKGEALTREEISTLSQITKFLKDNDIKADVSKSRSMRGLVSQLMQDAKRNAEVEG